MPEDHSLWNSLQLGYSEETLLCRRSYGSWAGIANLCRLIGKPCEFALIEGALFSWVQKNGKVHWKSPGKGFPPGS